MIMIYRDLGRTGLRVSRLCFGALTVGPLQARLTPEEGGRVIRTALEAGVNFIDTAEIYGTYEHIRRACAGFSGEVIIASKSYAYTWEGMRASVEKALRTLGTDHLGVFLLHEQESSETLRGHRPALEYLLEAKAKGLIRAVGVSTHFIRVVRAAALMPEIDVIHPLLNLRGVGIRDGTAAQMLEAIREAHRAGKGIYAMKPLGGGMIRHGVREAFRFLLQEEAIDSIAVGMRSVPEVRLNTWYFEHLEGSENPGDAGEVTVEALEAEVAGIPRRLLIEDHCAGCGQCVLHCPQEALSLREGRAVVDPAKCILCGYCGAFCPEVALKIV